jgi:HK97 family phage prohead protease
MTTLAGSRTSAGGAVEHSAPLVGLEVKTASGGERIVEGHAAVFDELDLGGDVIRRGAFDATLRARPRVLFLRQHDHNLVLGATLSLHPDQKGLFGRFKISKTPLGEETYQLLKDGALDSFSIGYRCPGAEVKADGTRELKEIELFEVSVVSLPMAPLATVTAVKRRRVGGAAGSGEVPRRNGMTLTQTRLHYLRRRLIRMGVLPLENPEAEALKDRLAAARARLEPLVAGAGPRSRW